MKITERQLKRIIKEEKSKILRESGDLYVNLTDDQENALYALEKATQACSDAGCEEKDMRDAFEDVLRNRQPGGAGSSFDEELGLEPKAAYGRKR